MKRLFKILIGIWLVMPAIIPAYAQNTAKKAPAKTTKSKSTTVTKQPTVPGKEVAITLNNKAEGTIAIFAGPKEALKDVTRKKTVGGLSKNTIYVHVNEMVCILQGEKTVSCAVIKPTTAALEINVSGNVITEK